ncbi:monocarboxylate transporter 9-like [Tropilaelaps mercedesae]|uniref:Monocarboxylate transporter 9-like n=1 Tax=Tropilaelaps mercedesae TaxID=418985 RepID=A0A1V9XYL6_9ACAR|nr:monocarboxylate transporter 9-like [Tropilaelaps mercedesae]
MYVGIMNQYGVSHKVASWPISVMGAMLSLIGVLAGPLAQTFSPRPVIIGGSLLISIGLIMSYFAPSVTWLTFTYGLIFGSGLGTVYTINVVFLQQYFVKMRGLALGMNYAGSTLAGFIFPLFVTYLMTEYGFRGTLLLLSALLLHICALCLMHHEAPWQKPGHATAGSATKVPAKDNGQRNSDTFTEVALDNSEPCPNATIKDAEKGQAGSGQKGRASLIESLSVFRIREFYVIIFSFTMFLYAYDALTMTLIDYIVDQGIPLLKATTVIPLYSVTDMVSRLTIPQLGDRGYINKMLLVALSYTVQTVSFFLLPIVASSGQFVLIAILTMIHSAGVGSSIVMYGVLMAEHVGPARLPMAYGIVGAIVGSTYFTKPYFIGM